MIRARKQFGQHFLEPVWVDKVIKAIHPQPDQVFVEIGPGPGALTRPLAQCAKSVTAFEIDRYLSAALVAEAIPNLTIVAGAVLTRQLSDFRLQPSALRLPGNWQYNIASPTMFPLLPLFAAPGPPDEPTPQENEPRREAEAAQRKAEQPKKP